MKSYLRYLVEFLVIITGVVLSFYLDDLRKLNFNKRTAILFGSEASGLSNNEISYANYTLQIPTNPEFKSLNLSHSLIIIAQFISSILKFKISNFKRSDKKLGYLYVLTLCILPP